MKKILSLICLIVLLLCLFSCSSKSVKSDLTPEIIAKAYEDSSYSTWCHTIKEENLDAYKYKSELKVYNPDNESKDYIFIYFFNDAEEAKTYEKECDSKTTVIWFFSLIFGEPGSVKYDRYDYIVVASEKSNEAKSRSDMIRIFKSAIYE